MKLRVYRETAKRRPLLDILLLPSASADAMNNETEISRRAARRPAT